MSRPFYITTAIDYANGKPHLGHAYEKVLTDFLARFHRRHGEEVFFLTGVDEHGLKVQQSAEKAGKDPQVFCDEISELFRDLCRRLNISNDDFVRTTEKRHKEVVQSVLQQLHDAGEIYEDVYKGHYSAKQEQFLTDKDRVEGEWPPEFGEVVFLEEKVYYFKLARHQEWLVDFLKKNPEWIFPAFRTKEVLGALENPIPDLCISRPAERLSWGIPLPFDESQVTYVWFDALINYISIPGYSNGKVNAPWPAVHVIGKDIMVPAHAVYWPIMLRAMGAPLPERLIVHGFWTRDQEKMSKSLGNVVDPLDLIETYGVDAFRYYVMREMALGQDADFGAEQFHQRYQAELANNLGNLVNRTVSMINRYRDGSIPEWKEESRTDSDRALEANVRKAIDSYRAHIDKLGIHLGLVELWKGITATNQYAEENAPWKLAKDESQAARLDQVLANMAAALWLCLGELEPLLPQSVERACAQLNVESAQPSGKEIAWPRHLSGTRVGKAEPLFPRIEKES